MNNEILIKTAFIYANYRNRSLSTVANWATNDGKFFNRLMEGKTCTLKTFNRTMCWFSNHWPAGLEWPANIPRPAVQKEKESAWWELKFMDQTESPPSIVNGRLVIHGQNILSFAGSLHWLGAAIARCICSKLMSNPPKQKRKRCDEGLFLCL